jgi:hypothetical protein
MKFKSLIISQGSGSTGGLTYSHNRGGMYIRSRATPTNPNSPQQQAVRSAMNALVAHWQETLTAAQRDAWKTYADNVPITDVLGESIYLTGMNHYIRSNISLVLAGLARVDDAPTIFDLGAFTDPSFVPAAATQDVAVTFDNTDAWANEDDAALLIFASREKAPTINYFKGPYRFAGKVDGDSVTPPTSPATISLPFAATAGNRVFFRAVVVRADARRSLDFRDLGVVV